MDGLVKYTWDIWACLEYEGVQGIVPSRRFKRYLRARHSFLIAADEYFKSRKGERICN